VFFSFKYLKMEDVVQRLERVAAQLEAAYVSAWIITI
jgi:hypothetical protein